MPDMDAQIEKLREKLDSERWARLSDQLAEMKAMIEAIPIEIGKDLGRLEHTSGEHGASIAGLKERMQLIENGFWFARLVGGVIVGTVSIAETWHILRGGK